LARVAAQRISVGRTSSFKTTLDKVKPAGRVKPAGYNVLRHAVAESWTGKSYKSMLALPDLATAGASTCFIQLVCRGIRTSAMS
jgi:hypothetical protein